MNWKKFLKPTPEKLALTLGILTLFTLIFGIPVQIITFCDCMIEPWLCDCPRPTIFVSIQEFIMGIKLIDYKMWLVSYLYVLEFFMSYLAASTIILMFKNERKRKTEE
jgi:hypothetical protein